MQCSIISLLDVGVGRAGEILQLCLASVFELIVSCCYSFAHGQAVRIRRMHQMALVCLRGREGQVLFTAQGQSWRFRLFQFKTTGLDGSDSQPFTSVNFSVQNRRVVARKDHLQTGSAIMFFHTFYHPSVLCVGDRRVLVRTHHVRFRANALHPLYLYLLLFLVVYAVGTPLHPVQWARFKVSQYESVYSITNRLSQVLWKAYLFALAYSTTSSYVLLSMSPTVLMDRMRAWWMFAAVAARSPHAPGSRALALSTKNPGDND